MDPCTDPSTVSGADGAHSPRDDAAGPALTELDLDECLRLVGKRGVGRLAFDDDHGPLVLPANYVFHGGVLHVRTGPGAKLVAADRRAPAAFEIDRIDEGGGWSVLIRGRLRRLLNADGPGNPPEPVPAAPGHRNQLIALVPRHISGRRVGPDQRPGARGRWDDLGNIWWDRDGSDLLG